MRSHQAAAVLVVVLLALTACTPTANRPQARPSSPSATSATVPAESVLRGVIATGALVSSAGTTSGRIVLTAAGNTVTATVKDFRTKAAGRFDVQLSPEPISAKCPADSWSFVMNGVDSEKNAWSLPLRAPGGPFEVDPTYLRTAVLRVDADAGEPNADGCIYPVLAVAPLHWSIAPTHIGLVVADQGTRPHATGMATSAGGHPSTYTVAPDDTLEAIWARFGITEDDFTYLNPYNGTVDTANLKYGTVFNLSPANRGAPTS